MGIHNLIKYINIKNSINLAQCESGNNIYISNIVYFDMTYKLIEIYNKFMNLSNKVDIDFEFRINELLSYMEKELLNMFTKLKNFNRIIYVFIDYKFMNNLKERNIVFKDFLNMNIEEHEHVNSIPMIKRKYLKLLDNEDEYNTMKYLIKKIRCMFELKSIYSVSNKLDIEKYISIPYLIKLEKNEGKHKKLSILLDEGKFRYLMLRGGKYLVKKQRRKKLFSFFGSETSFSPCSSRSEKNISPCDNESTTFNVDKLLFNSVSKNGIEKFNEFNNYIPFTIIIYLFPMFVKKINFDNVKFFGCEIESDFALSKHVHAYSKNAFPTIYSSDTDMLCLMCDVDCIIKLSIKNNKQKYLKNTKNSRNDEQYIYKCHNNVNVSNNSTFYINPVRFWQGIFKCKLSTNIIKILCVLMGTDYNPYHPKSPIHIRHFHDILKILNVDKFENIDEDILLAKIYVIMKNNENDIHCMQTAIALNIYLNELESKMHFITKNTNVNKIDMQRFLKYSKQTILT